MALAVARFAPAAYLFAVLVEDEYLLLELLGAIDVAFGVQGYAGGPGESPGEVALEFLVNGQLADALVGRGYSASAFLPSAQYVEFSTGAGGDVHRLGESVPSSGVPADGVAEVPGSSGYGRGKHDFTPALAISE